MIINIISSIKGGGAEKLVSEIQSIYLKKNILFHNIYFSGNHNNVDVNNTILGTNPRSPLNIFRLRKVIKKLLSSNKKGLIVHAHLTWPFFYSVLAIIGLKKISLFFTEHNTYNRRRKIPFFWIFERFFYNKYKKIVCISKGTQKSLSKWVGPNISGKLITIMNGSKIYNLKNRSSINERLPKLISIGSLSKQKNFSTIIHAIAKIKDDIDTYLIIGEGKEEKKLNKIIQLNNLKDKVKLIGWSDKIENYLCISDILIIPSLWEGFGLVAIEGMSTGLPIVASNVEGLVEVTGDSSPSVNLVKEIRSSEAWANEIKKTIEKLKIFGPKYISKISHNHSKKFSLDKMAKSYLDMYHST